MTEIKLFPGLLSALIMRLGYVNERTGEANLKAFSEAMPDELRVEQPVLHRYIKKGRPPDPEIKVRLAKFFRSQGVPQKDLEFLDVKVIVTEQPALTEEEKELLIRFRALPDVLRKQVIAHLNSQAALAKACPALSSKKTATEFQTYMEYEMNLAGWQLKSRKAARKEKSDD